MAENTQVDETREKITYIYRCPNCHKFSIEKARNDGLLCHCGTKMELSKPEETIKHYKKVRTMMNLMTILFTIVFPVFILCMFMFVAEDSKTNELGYKLPIIALVLIGAIIMKGRQLLDRTIGNTEIFAIKAILTFINKNVFYLVIIGILGIILGFINAIGDSLMNIIIALVLVVISNSIGYCVFDYWYHEANYIVKRAVRQSETLQALEMSDK